MKSLSDAIELRNHLIANLEEADYACGTPRASLLNFEVAGGGFAGVETIAAMNDFLREAVPFFPHIRNNMLRLILVNSGKAILPEFREKLGTYAQRKLTEQKLKLHSNCQVTAVTDHTPPPVSELIKLGPIPDSGESPEQCAKLTSQAAPSRPILHGTRQSILARHTSRRFLFGTHPIVYTVILPADPVLF